MLSEADAEVSGTKITNPGVKKKNILGMALHAWHVFFEVGGGRWVGAAAILHNALMGRLWLRRPLQVWQKGSFVRQYHKVHYVE